MIKLSKVEQFQLFCLENYKAQFDISGKIALDVFESKGVFNFLEMGFEVLHTQSIKYVEAEIIDFIKNKS